MDPPSPKSATSSLFEVYLRLRPSPNITAERFLDVEHNEQNHPTHITIKPPQDSKKKGVERYAFTRVFEEAASQLDIFKGTGALPLIEGVLGAEGKEGRDGLLATLGVTGSGKSHTILGTKTQRGLTQMALDALFQATESRIVNPNMNQLVSLHSIVASDVSEADILPAASFLDSLYGDGQSERPSRAQTPMPESSFFSFYGKSRNIPRPSMLPQLPSLQDVDIPSDPTAEYAVVVSMYEVYNDRIYDLLTASALTSKFSADKRRALLFKSTEQSPDRKVVAGLKKIICGNLEEALMVLETGLMERKVAGTGSNAVSSRSHGFFCVEVKKRHRASRGPWSTSTLTIVDLAGSERARNAKTAGAALTEAGNINLSLMYLGQCMQMQNDAQSSNKQTAVPFRSCKLTEILCSNQFPSNSSSHHQRHGHHHRNPQKSVMIVTADPHGDFNATSQILRYSALAREVTVPRIPSYTQTILAGAGSVPARKETPSGRTSPSASLEELEHAAQEIARLTEELETTQLRLAEEIECRRAAEASWQVAEERMLDMEQQIRDECCEEMESRIEAERRRWKASWDEEADRNDEHLDRKIDILARSIQIYEDPEPSEDERVAELEMENEALRRKIAMMEREMHNHSPTKKQRILKTRRWAAEVGFESP